MKNFQFQNKNVVHAYFLPVTVVFLDIGLGHGSGGVCLGVMNLVVVHSVSIVLTPFVMGHRVVAVVLVMRVLVDIVVNSVLRMILVMRLMPRSVRPGGLVVDSVVRSNMVVLMVFVSPVRVGVMNLGMLSVMGGWHGGDGHDVGRLDVDRRLGLHVGGLRLNIDILGLDVGWLDVSRLWLDVHGRSVVSWLGLDIVVLFMIHRHGFGVVAVVVGLLGVSVDRLGRIVFALVTSVAVVASVGPVGPVSSDWRITTSSVISRAGIGVRVAGN